MTIRDRVKGLRNILEKRRIDAWVVPSSDPHQSEYVADAWKRREFISGFTGSAGVFVCTRSRAGLWTDARYHLQAEGELADTDIELLRQGEKGVPDWRQWLGAWLPKGAKVGLNCSLFSIEAYDQIKIQLTECGLQLIPFDTDLVDEIWGTERPSLPTTELRAHAEVFAGESCQSKIQRVRDFCGQQNVHGLVISALDEIAWLLNLRGADVTYNPVFYAFVLVTKDRITLAIDPEKMSPSLRQLYPYLRIVPYGAWGEFLEGLAPQNLLAIDSGSNSAALRQQLEQHQCAFRLLPSPIPGWKAKKNAAEIEGMKKAHQRDGVAMVHFLAWLETAVRAGVALDEISAADQLECFRQEQEGYFGPSFATISGFGAHGAQPHYRASQASCSALRAPGIFLLDSGGQYDAGTTDITRTMSLGAASPQQKQVYTQVLKGHLQLGRAWFPQGTNGYQLDVLARASLWQSGYDYAHGTGHGVGAALCVHEGPFSVSIRKNMVSLELGHVLSNEPACYHAGQFGVRIENLVHVVQKANTPFGEFLGFEDLTLCPYDRSLIDLDLLSKQEIEQIDAYHRRVRDELELFIRPEAQDYFRRATAPLGSPL